ALFSAGAAPPAAALLAYDAICFGGPFELSSRHELATRYRELASGGLAGIGLPRLDALYGLLLSPSRGLFFFAPILLAAAVGIASLFHIRERRTEACLLAAGALLPILAFS